MTRSPGVQPLTPSPRAAISPANSVPARAGLAGAVAARNCAPRISSPRFVPAARTATTTWPGPGAGTGLSRNSNTAPSGPGTVNHAFIVCVIAETLLGQAFGRSAASNINDTVAAFTSPQSESSSSRRGVFALHERAFRVGPGPEIGELGARYSSFGRVGIEEALDLDHRGTNAV